MSEISNTELLALLEQRLDKLERNQSSMGQVLGVILSEGRERKQRLELLEEGQKLAFRLLKEGQKGLAEGQKGLAEGQQKIIGLLVEMQGSEQARGLDHEQRISRLEERCG